ncbi:ribosome recycling factor family protein [Colwellia psychrerythraea]|uniref:Ribosome recycling factor n=1 Tax=Colwellia psychrerythraea TaxID=28229 RepID=A0A099KPH0_COLPS|nr:ribosome recycling factor family protein [Colwellia psychrerythraea]KGJ91832.1 Ribosome recycling factor [Colwellia psychrerythraea]
MEIINAINLPSFVRRTLKAYALKAHIKQLGCGLSRIGRSRNWQLKANFSQIQAIIEFIEQEQEESWFWLVKLLRKEYQHLSHESLLALASPMSGITITALMAKTDCTLAQARKVLDALEGID